ncbi:MAG: hypothetical protein IJP21_00575 [Clostridia bacterium]|nr:hypothetical protein [Clostridia bacterium]
MKYGWAEEKFVFPKPVALMGQFATRISEYEEKPLTVTALAVDSGEDQMVLCSVDIISINYPLTDEVRRRLADCTEGLDPMKVVISAIHTHTGPGYTGRSARKANIGFDSKLYDEKINSLVPPEKRYAEKPNVYENPDIMNGDELLEELASKITKTVADAWKNRKEGSFSNAFGRAVVGMCRRVAYNDGSAQMWGDTNTAMFTQVEGGNDSGIELMYVFDENKKLTGIVANLACPAQCVQHRLFISPDFWGEAKMLLRKHFGEDLFLLPLCSAAGDQCPVDLVRWVEPESDVNDPNLKRNNPPKRKADPSMFDLAGMRKAGKRIANEIIEVYNEGLDEPQTDIPLIHHVHNMQLPLRRVTMAEEKEACKEAREYLMRKEEKTDFNDTANLQRAFGIIRRALLQEIRDVVDTEVHIIRLGSIAFASNPFELFLDYGNQIKARSKAEQSFIIQLACAADGYLPTEKAEKGGHYSAFVGSGTVGHVGGEQLVRETVQDINEMFK